MKIDCGDQTPKMKYTIYTSIIKEMVATNDTKGHKLFSLRKKERQNTDDMDYTDLHGIKKWLLRLRLHFVGQTTNDTKEEIIFTS
jgi:uncharacterized membrane protein